MQRARAHDAAVPGGWLELVLEHHGEIERMLVKAGQHGSDADRREARDLLQALYSAHANAEEMALYPALALISTVDAHKASVEHAAIQLHMTQLNRLQPSDSAYESSFSTLRITLLNHLYAEEIGGLLLLQDRTQGSAQQRLRRSYEEEHGHYLRVALSILRPQQAPL